MITCGNNEISCGNSYSTLYSKAFAVKRILAVIGLLCGLAHAASFPVTAARIDGTGTATRTGTGTVSAGVLTSTGGATFASGDVGIGIIYQGMLAWILDQLRTVADVFEVLGITSPEIGARSKACAFKIEREYYISAGRLDLLLTLDDSMMVIIEVKKYSAESSDTAKQAGYHEWLESQPVQHRIALLLTTDAAEERYQNFSILLWADVCLRLRRLLPALGTRISSVKTAMFVAFIGAVETNLLNLVAPSRETDAVDRLFYARTIEHL